MTKELTKEQIERKEKRERDFKQSIKSLKKIAKLTVLDDAFDKMMPKREIIKKHKKETKDIKTNTKKKK